MKAKIKLLLVALLLTVLLPVFVFAQAERKGTYASLGINFASYKLDVFNYVNRGNNYSDASFSQLMVSLGIEKKSVWQKNNLVFDIGGYLTGGFGDATALGAHALFKAGYLISKNNRTIVPLIGLGPYFVWLQDHPDNFNDKVSNYIYGLQGFAGADFRLSNKYTLTPQLRFGLASWGSSDKELGGAEVSQNGQPSMLEIGLKLAMKL